LIDGLADDAEVLLAGGAEEADGGAAEADADAESDGGDVAAGRAPFRAPAGGQLIEARVQLAAGVVHHALEHRRRVGAGELREEDREEAVTRVLEDDAAMALDDLGHLGQVLADQVGEVLRVVEHARQIREAADVDRDDGDLMGMRDQHARVGAGAEGLLQGRRAGMVRRGRDRAGAPSDDRRGRRPEPARRLGGDQPDQEMGDARGLTEGRPGAGVDQPAGDRSRHFGLVGPAGEDQIELPGPIAHDVDRRAGRAPRDRIEEGICHPSQHRHAGMMPDAARHANRT